jgi:hypothetical protein
MGKRKPGRKSGLPPRTPNSRLVWNTTKINFATDTVVKPLQDAGWAFDENDIASEFAAAGLNACIRELVVDYISVLVSARTARKRDWVTPEKLRKAVAKLERDITNFVIRLPNDAEHAIDRVVIEALNCELDAVDSEQAPDVEFIRTGLDALKNAVRRVRIAESGAGPPANREALQLVLGLRTIFKERTGKIPSSNPDGRFGHFVRAVNDLIPEKFQLVGLKHLIAAAANTTS